MGQKNIFLEKEQERKIIGKVHIFPQKTHGISKKKEDELNLKAVPVQR